jgi:hypothetical protein
VALGTALFVVRWRDLRSVAKRSIRRVRGDFSDDASDDPVATAED